MKREMFLALILLGLTTTAEGTAPFNRPRKAEPWREITGSSAPRSRVTSQVPAPCPFALFATLFAGKHKMLKPRLGLGRGYNF